MATRKVTVDTSHLDRDTAQLASGITSGAKRESYFQAVRTSSKIRDLTPVLTGRLRATVGTVDVTGGTGVTYGDGRTVYHFVQNARKRIVRRGTRGARADWYRTLQALAAREVGRV